MSKHKSRGTKYKYKDTLFASIYEASLASTLDTLGIEWEYEPVALPWQPTVRTRYYTPDFLVKESDGTEYFIEAKGYFEPDARSKMLAIRKQYPELDIRFAFMQPKNKIGKLTYPEWAIKRGYGLVDIEVQSVDKLPRVNTDGTPASDKRESVKTPRQTPKSGTQSDSSSRRSSRAKEATVQTTPQKKSRKNSQRSNASISLCA